MTAEESRAGGRMTIGTTRAGWFSDRHTGSSISLRLGPPIKTFVLSPKRLLEDKRDAFLCQKHRNAELDAREARLISSHLEAAPNARSVTRSLAFAAVIVCVLMPSHGRAAAGQPERTLRGRRV